jgi:hypothetical protein
VLTLSRYIDKDFLALLDAPETKLEYKQVNLRTVDRHVEVLTPPAEWNGKETGWVKFDALFDLTGEVGFDKPELVSTTALFFVLV